MRQACDTSKKIGSVDFALAASNATLRLWINDELSVTLHRQWDVPADYTVTSDAPGFLLLRLDSAGNRMLAAVPAVTISPTNGCVHSLDAPLTFGAAGCATALPGTYVWTYGETTVATNKPLVTIPGFAYPLPRSLSVTFIPDAAGAAGADGAWPADAEAPIGYCPHAFRLSPLIVEKTNLLHNTDNTVQSEPFQVRQAATAQHLTELMNLAHGDSNDPFLLFHTYEHTTTFPPAYMYSGATAYLLPGDPIRNQGWPRRREAPIFPCVPVGPVVVHPPSRQRLDRMNCFLLSISQAPPLSTGD